MEAYLDFPPRNSQTSTGRSPAALRNALLATLLTAGTLATAPVQAAPVAGMGTWQSTLQARDINGDGTTDAFYDTVLNITWLADGNAGAGTRFDDGASASDGKMTWSSANAWAGSLSVYGVTGWRLPTMIDTGASGCTGFADSGTDCGYNVQTISADGKTVYSEWAHLFYVTLGNLAYCDETGDCSPGIASTAPDYMLKNTGNFRNLQAWAFWSGVPYAPSPSGSAWFFSTISGGQGNASQGNDGYALAVRPGDVTAAAPVPEPQGLALVLAALAALRLARGRRRAA